MALVLYKEQSITNASVIADNIKYSKKHEMFLSVSSDRNEQLYYARSVMKSFVSSCYASYSSRVCLNQCEGKSSKNFSTVERKESPFGLFELSW